MIASTLVLFIVAVVFGYAAYWHERIARGDVTAYTFIVDPPTMFLVGMLGAMLGLFTRKGRKLTQEQFRARKTWIDRLLAVFFVGFWCMELLSYFDLMKHPYDASKTGNDFMWNGYVDLLGWHPFHFAQATYHYWWSWLLIPAMMLVQWKFLRAGRVIGYMNGFMGNLNNWSKPRPPEAKPATPAAKSAEAAEAKAPSANA